jgi:peptidoglycan hydrolase CwlO-like protein
MEETMKKLIVFLMAATLFTASVPAFASTHGTGHDPADADCARDCELLLKNCSQDVDTIQQKIRKLETAIRKEGAKPERVAEVKVLKQKLDEAKETLRSIEKGGH